MTLDALDTAGVARALALVANRQGDHAELFFERRTEFVLPPAGGGGGIRVRSEEGLAARLLRGERSWLASRDELSSRAFAQAVRAVARVLPPALPEPAVAGADRARALSAATGVEAFPGRLERALRRRLVGFSHRLTVRWLERDLRVVTQRTATGVETERFASLEVDTAWGPSGMLATELDDTAAEALAARMAAIFLAREAPPPDRSHPPLLFSPAAAAVALHECVAHALEADLLSASGHPGAADGIEIGSGDLDVLDYPGGAPKGVARGFDDEGTPTCRRWLLRGGRVAQPIADLRAARRWTELLPGSGFRADRHSPPLPRTHHLELLAGSADEAALLGLAEGGLEIGEIGSGTLDVTSGRFILVVPAARRIRGGEPAEPVGPFQIRGRIASLLSGVVAVGSQRRAAGAGWCAKGNQRRPVWATAPAIVVAGLEVAP